MSLIMSLMYTTLLRQKSAHHGCDIMLLQVFVQPGSYHVKTSELTDKTMQQVWLAPERTYIPYALLVLILPTNG